MPNVQIPLPIWLELVYVLKFIVPSDIQVIWIDKYIWYLIAITVIETTCILSIIQLVFFFVFLSSIDVSAITCIMEPWTEKGHHQKNTKNVENSMYNYNALMIYLARTWAYTEPDNEEL